MKKLITILFAAMVLIFCASVMQRASSTTGGSGASMASVGGEKCYCAATDRAEVRRIHARGLKDSSLCSGVGGYCFMTITGGNVDVQRRRE